jgi:transposase
MQYMRAQIKRAGTPGPKAIGIDEISIRKGHTYRIVVSDLDRRRPIWFGGEDRSRRAWTSSTDFSGKRRPKRSARRDGHVEGVSQLRRTSNAPQAAILFDKFHVIFAPRRGARQDPQGRIRPPQRQAASRFIKGQKYTLLSHPQNLTGTARKNLKLLLAANKRLNTAYLLKESFGQLWDYNSEAWARKFFENWRASSNGSA